jgi:2-(1,2-epoxy-1,2-dihydrophenyl)acetyl-CoA isomerase
MAESVIIKNVDGIVTLLLNRPQTFNAFDVEMIGDVAANLITLSADKTVRAIVISGQGKAFCAGGDIKWVLGFPQGFSAAFHELAARFHQAILEIRRMPKPVIAAINGMAAGGGFSLALACDFRVMAQSVLLRQAYTSNGLCIDGGGSFTLPRIVGLARALEIMAFDQPISSERAAAWGLVTKVVEDEKVLEEANHMAHELAKISLNSFRLSKNLLTDSFDSSFETHIERERGGLAGCAAHPEGIEGMRAFAEKRKPVFNSL